ncbi:MAG: dienelactone hydrolase family protein [Verrucomicrobiaceae bacterium]|jgi:predicted peptidase|nr:dienelactone hydrolase family protein [Verrucomicrobiaceae bacterium]
MKALLPALLILSSTLHAATPPREWTSADGKSKFKGDLVEFSDKEVRIRRSSDFNQFKLPLEKLSQADRDYVFNLLREKRRDSGLKDGAHADKITGQFVKAVSKQGLNYQVWGNPKLDATKRYPLIIWLHGAGQSGSDNESQLGGAPKNWVTEANQAKNPCFLLAPQCPSRDIGWKEQVAANVIALIADLSDHLPIDESRIYLTGSSMGGSGTWYMAAKYPQVFAACVPLCGGGDPKNAEVLKALPFWVFHGDADDQVPVDRSRVMVEAVKKAGGELMNYSELAGEGHGITGVVYPREDLRDWLFQQKKEAPTAN